MRINKDLGGKKEKTIPLKEVTHGSVFRFADETLEKAIGHSDEQPGLLFVIANVEPVQSTHVGRRAYVPLGGGKLQWRDEDWSVIVHDFEVSIKAAELI